MASYLLEHARLNVWCSPEQDAQVVIRPTRVSPANGIRRRIDVNWETVPLPEINNTNQFWLVFNLGPLPEHIYNLPHVKREWVRLDDVCRTTGVFIQPHTLKGLTMPLTYGFLRLMEDETFIIAYRYNTDLTYKASEEDLLFRLYSSTYYEKEEWLNRPDKSLRTLESFGGIIGRDITAERFLHELSRVRDKEWGTTFIYINGVYTSRFASSLVKDGDTVSFVHDRSFKRTDVWSIPDLHSFQSLIDPREKLLLHPLHKGGVIDYHDDVDFYLARTDRGGNRRGVYYGRYQKDAVRQVTHNSYSLVSHYIDVYMRDNEFFEALGNEEEFDPSSPVEVVAFTRWAGYEDRPLIHEVNRIRELYRLDLKHIWRAMNGLNSLVPEWRVEHLEASSYPKLMGVKLMEIDKDLVADAYGYNSVTRVSYPDLHVFPKGNDTITKMGDYLDLVATSFDKDGLMYGVKPHRGEELISPTLPASKCHLIELQSGDLKLNEGGTYYGLQRVTAHDSLDEIGYRVYVCDILDGIPSEEWVDVTGDGDYYVVESDGLTITWNTSKLEFEGQYPATRFGNHVWVKSPVPWAGSFPGYIEFTLSSVNSWCYPDTDSDELRLYRPDTVPYGQLEVYMDGEYLIEGLDYFTIHPKVVITKPPKRLPIDGLEIIAKQTSFLDVDRGRSVARDVGWVRGGMVSGNGKWDTRNDRNFKVVVGGRVKHRSEVKWSEYCDGPPQPDGQPYAVIDTIQPVEGLLGRNTTDFRGEALDVDERVQDYFTTIDPGKQPTIDDTIPQLYRVYEPMLGAVIELLLNGWLAKELFTPYSANQMDEWLEPVKFLLDFSPILKPVDPNYVSVTPHHYDHPVMVSEQQYLFLSRIVNAYFNGKISLTPYLTVKDPCHD